MVSGPLTSEATIQVTEEVYRPREVVCCTPGSTAPAITTLNDDGYTFRVISSDAFQGRALAQVADQRVGASSVSILYVNDAYGQALNRTFTEAFEERGGTVQSSASIAQEQSSYSSKLATAMEGDPDALFVVAFPGSAVQLLRDFYDSYGTDTPIIGPDSLRDPELPDQVGQSLTNVIGVSSIAAGPGNDTVAQLYQDEYGEDTPPFFSYAYDSAAVLVLANAAAGENDGPTVRDQMQPIANPGGTEVTPGNFAEGVAMAADGEEVQYRGASSDVDFDENGDMKSVNYAIYRYTESDEIEDIDTINYTAD
jgi:ABC-type branched-subunit amino acid transport system substrate-binding protein